MAAGVLCFLLPETNNLPLPETIQESVDMEKSILALFLKFNSLITLSFLFRYTLSFNRCCNKDSNGA